MANEEVIRQQMEETRTSLTEKLETLENQVLETVHGATAAVSETVESIKESVQETVTTVKDTVEETVGTVKEKVADSVETVKEYMDLGCYVREYPWLSVGGAVAVGYCLGTLLGGRRQAAPMTEQMARAAETPRTHHVRNGGHGQRRKQQQESASWLSELGPEIAKLKGLALGALMGTAREMITANVPGQMGDHLRHILDNMTNKLGGEPLPSSDFDALRRSEGDSHEQRHETEMGGTMGSASRSGSKAMGQFDRR